MMEPSDDLNQNNPFEDPGLLTPDSDEGYTEKWPESDDVIISKPQDSDDRKKDGLPIVSTAQPASAVAATPSVSNSPGTPPPEKPSRSASLIKSRLNSLKELQNPVTVTSTRLKGKRRARSLSTQEIAVEYGDVVTAKKRVMVCSIKVNIHYFFICLDCY